MQDNLESYIGRRYGRLVVEGVQWLEGRGRNALVCRCDCGATRLAMPDKLECGKVRSCGCLLRESLARRRAEAEERRRKRAERYAQYLARIEEARAEKARRREEAAREADERRRERAGNMRLYWVWQGMWRRCTNPRHHKYPLYGGRGIAVCDAWRDFHAFLVWARSSGYADGLSIDRVDTDGGYSPQNCRWADDWQQQNNRRNNRRLRIGGEVATMSEWARRMGIGYETMRTLVRAGRFEVVG